MANFQINWVSTDITLDVINYSRTESICEGTRTLQVVIKDTGKEFLPWEMLTLWESGNKVGKFYINDITDMHDGSMKLACQDGSLKLHRYFEERTWHPGWVSNSKYWISLWLDRAGVNYNFTAVGNGSTVNKDVTFGNDFTGNLIQPLLQQSNWYMLFDDNNVLQIGELDVDTKSVSETFNETDIIDIRYTKSDKQARNRVVVWGGRDMVTDTWISGSAEANADWQIDNNDDRTVLISSNAIQNYGSAYYTANQLLNSVIDMSKEKQLTVTGYRNRVVGELVHVESRVYNGNGLITDLEVRTDSASGYITILTLDRRCPRLFAYFSWDGYVYAGTRGGGIYRKPFETATWSNYSSGLENLNILDLYIDHGVFVCITEDGYAYRSTDATGYWVKLSHGEVEDSNETVYEETDIRAIACSIDSDGTIIVGYNHKTEDLAWMVHFNVYSGITRKEQVIVDGNEEEIEIYDLDNTGEVTVISTAGASSTPGEGLIVRNWDKYDLDHKDSTGYYSDSEEILDANYTIKSTENIRGVHGKYVFNAVYEDDVDWHCVLQKVLLASGTVVSSIDMHSDGYGQVLGTNLALWNPHVISEDLIIIDGTYTDYFYAVDFSTETATTWRYSDKDQYTNHSIATSNGDFYCLYNTTDPPNYTQNGWYDGVDPEKWYLEINGSSPIQIISEEEDWQLTYTDYSVTTPEGDFSATSADHRDQYMMGIYETAGGGAVIPCIEVLQVYAYEEEYGDYYNGGYDILSFNWGIIGFKSIACAGGEASQSDIAEVFETKKDEMCWNMTPSLTHKIWRNLYSYSTMSYDIVPDYFNSGGVVAHWHMSTQAAGCTPGDYDYPDKMYVWGAWFATEFKTGAYDYHDYFITFGDEPEIVATRDYETDPVIVVFGQGAVGAWYWGDDNAFHSVTGGPITGTVTDSDYLTIDSKSCDITGNYVATDSVSHKLYIIDSSLTKNEIMTLSSSETRAELLGQNIFTIKQVLYVSDEAQASDLPATAGTVIKDLYYTEENLPEDTDLFVTILEGIVGYPRVELSRSTPVIVYTVPGISSSYTYSNFTLEEDDWNALGTAYRLPMADAKLFYSENGDSSFGGFQIAVATNGMDLKSGSSRLDEEFTVVFSGAIITSGSQPLHRLEISNGVSPYFFASTSGSASTASQFFQRNPGLSTFTEYSTGLPANNITTIRVDDRIS